MRSFSLFTAAGLGLLAAGAVAQTTPTQARTTVSETTPSSSTAATTPTSATQDMDYPRAWVLLIDNAALYAAPGDETRKEASGWKAALPLEALERAEAAGEMWYRFAHGEKSGWLPEAYIAAPSVDHAPEAIGAELVDRYHGLAPEYAPQDLVSVGPGYEQDVDYRLRREAAGALKALVATAREQGIRLKVISAYRPWQKQQQLYQRRVLESGRGQTTVAKPGHSEHQLGTAVDFTGEDESAQLRVSFAETPEGLWLAANARMFGFAQTYTAGNQQRTGYSPEPWHFRYWGLANLPPAEP